MKRIRTWLIAILAILTLDLFGVYAAHHPAARQGLSFSNAEPSGKHCKTLVETEVEEEAEEKIEILDAVPASTGREIEKLGFLENAIACPGGAYRVSLAFGWRLPLLI